MEPKNKEDQMKKGQSAVTILILLALLGVGGVLYLSGQIKPPPVQTFFSPELKFNNDAAVIPLAPGSGEKSLEEVASADEYYVEYQKPFDLYLLVITKGPVDEVRQKAEQAVLQAAGGDRDALCALNFRVVFSKEGEGVAYSEEGLAICQ